ncbi:transposase [Candidatus Bathyarchaeota archaeon]|nr:transposase [Candidatus Bathyarchaeota archaeon]
MMLPEWVQKHKTVGKEVRNISGRYYLYEVTSKYDPAKKRSQKITKRYLGRITPEGLTKPNREILKETMQQVSIKEYGATYFTLTHCSNIIELLKTHYPQEWEQITAFAITRLFYSSPLKNVQVHYAASHLSDALKDAQVSPESLTKLLHSIGLARGRMVEFMKNFIEGSQVVIDLTHIFSLSEGVISATLGHNGQGQYLPQVNLVLLHSLEKKTPSFFRLVPGSIRDVSTVVASVKEAQLSAALVIGDKGFYSELNVAALEEEKLEYLLPLKRNSSQINYAPTRSGDRKRFDGFFQFDERVIWYREQKLKSRADKEAGRRVFLFLDEKLKAEEEKDFMSHVKAKKLGAEEYFERQFCMGTIAVITNCSFRAQRVFELLKERLEVEQVFDTFKNTLHADRSFMRDDLGLQGWMFVNFVALLLYYRFYDLLLQCEVLDKYSPRDVILHLSRVFKLRIGEKWVLSEVPKSSKILMEKLKIQISIT